MKKCILLLIISILAFSCKKGKKNAKEKEEETSKSFKKLSYTHSAVESNINQLEHHLLNRCPGKGLHRFKTYETLGGYPMILTNRQNNTRKESQKSR